MAKTPKRFLWALKPTAPEAESLRLCFGGLLEPGLNGNNGLIREHFKTAGWRKRRMETAVFDLGIKQRIKTPCRVRFIRYYAVHAMDVVNAVASFKHLEDAIVKANILHDDDPEHVTDLACRQVKVATKKEQRTVVEYTHDPLREGFGD